MEKDKLDHPWLTGAPTQPISANRLPEPELEPAPEAEEEPPKERDVFDLAADLKNAVRDERIHRSEKAKKNR